jgi:hypothetical protein
LEDRLEGLDTYHPGQPAVVLTPALLAKILAATRKKPKDGSTHWSCRKLAAAIQVSEDMVHRVWRGAGLKRRRLERFLGSDDPEFERKAADVIGLYLNSPPDRLDPVLPLSPGRAERHGFEYHRHGTLSLYAALDTRTGRVHGKPRRATAAPTSWISSAKWSRNASRSRTSTKSSARSSLAACSPRCPIWLANCAATSTPIQLISPRQDTRGWGMGTLG